MIFFKNDWINFHFNLDRNQKKRLSKWDVFSYSTNLSAIRFNGFKEELENTCLEIYKESQSLGNKLGLFLSGGIDSEIIARTLVALDIPFESYFISFENNLNDHEELLVRDFERTCNHKVQYIKVDIKKWLTSDNGFKFFCNRYRTFDIAAPLQMWARTQIGKEYSMISGIFEPHLHKIPTTEKCQMEWVHAFDESSVCSRVQFLEENQYLDFPFFYLYRPELYAAYCFDPFVQKMLTNPYKLSLVSTKKEMMKSYFPDMLVRQKYSGFEFVKDMCAEAHRTYQHEYVDGQLRISHSVFEKLFKYDK